MFCTKYGSDQPDDSQFCHKCGQAFGTLVTASTSSGMAAVAAPATSQPKTTVRQSFILGLCLVLVASVWYIGHEIQQDDRASQTQATSETGQRLPQLYKIEIGTGALTVNAASYWYSILAVPTGARNVSVQG